MQEFLWCILYLSKLHNCIIIQTKEGRTQPHGSWGHDGRGWWSLYGLHSHRVYPPANTWTWPGWVLFRTGQEPGDPGKILSSSYSVLKLFCLKLKISETDGLNGLYFSWMLYKFLGMVTGYFSDIYSLSLDSRGKSTSCQKNIRVKYISKLYTL